MTQIEEECERGVPGDRPSWEPIRRPARSKKGDRLNRGNRFYRAQQRYDENAAALLGCGETTLRSSLLPLVGQRREFRAVFGRYRPIHVAGVVQWVMLLEHVRLEKSLKRGAEMEKRQYLCDHVFIQLPEGSERWLRHGDIVVLSAQVEAYSKKKNTRWVTDIGLVRPQDIRVAGKGKIERAEPRELGLD